MSSRILGQKGAHEQGKEYSGGPGQPTITGRKWVGDKQSMLLQMAQVANEGFVFRMVEDGPVATLYAETPNFPGTDPSNTVIADVWELLPGEAEKDLLEVDVAIINGLSASDKESIRAKVANPNDPSITLDPDDPQTVADLMIWGQRSRIVFAPVLRHTQTVSSLYTVTASVENVNRIIKAETIIANEGLPAGFLIALDNPPFAYGTVERDGTTTGQIYTFDYGFLKKYPNLHQVVGNRLQIVQEWQFGLWPRPVFLSPI